MPAATVPSNESAYPATPFQFGDYQGLAIDANGRAHALWTDSRHVARVGEQIYATLARLFGLGLLSLLVPLTRVQPAPVQLLTGLTASRPDAYPSAASPSRSTPNSSSRLYSSPGSSA